MRLTLAIAALLTTAGLLAPPMQTPPVPAAQAPVKIELKAVAKVAQDAPIAATKYQVSGQQPGPQPSAPKAPTLTMPDEVHVAPGNLAQILLQTDPGVTLHYQWVGPKGAAVFREYDPDVTHVSYQVLGQKAGTFYLVVFAVKDGQVAKGTCTIVIDPPQPAPQPAPTPPGPQPAPPGPQPTPPAPADPLIGQLQQLYTADPADAATKASVKAALAGLYSGMASQLGAGQYATVQEASDALKAQAQALPLGTHLIPLRKACAAEVSAAVGPAPAAKLEPPLRAKLVSTFGRLASALNAVK